MEVFFILILTILMLLYVVYSTIMKKQKYWEELGVPTVPNRIPYFGHIWPVLLQRTSFGEMYLNMYKSLSNSSMIGVFVCGSPELLITDPELIKTILQTNFSSFQENGYGFDPESDSLLKHNPFVNAGDKWKNERAILINTMSSSKLKNMSITIHEICSKFLKYLNKNLEPNKGVLEIEAQSLFARFTGEVVAAVGFGIDGQCFEKDTGTFVDMGSKIFQPTGMTAFKQFIVFLFPVLAKFLKTDLLPEKFNIYCRQIVREVLNMRQMQGKRGNDFIQYICDLCKSDGKEVDAEFVTCHATSFYVDGYLTSSHTLSFLAYDIARNPEVQDKLRNEITETLKKYNGELSYEAILEMKYLDLVIKESMRSSSLISALQKKCTEKFKLIGHDGVECVVEPGTKIIICPLATHNDPRYWKNPMEFRPERFDDDHKNDFPKFAYLPFGGGARICVGMRMALLQMKYAIATLINKYSITVSSKTKLPFTYGSVALFNIPRGGIWINIKPL